MFFYFYKVGNIYINLGVENILFVLGKNLFHFFRKDYIKMYLKKNQEEL